MTQGAFSFLPELFVAAGGGAVVVAVINAFVGKNKGKAEVVDITADAAQKQVGTSLNLVEALDKQLHDALNEVASLRAEVVGLRSDVRGAIADLDNERARSSAYARALVSASLPIPQVS